MLSKKYRLAKTKDIENVAKKGQKAFTPFLMLKYLANSLPFSRVTVIVSKKVSNKAVIRNRIRRIINEMIRLKFNDIRPGLDLMILVSPKIMVNGKIIERTEIEKAVCFVLSKF